MEYDDEEEAYSSVDRRLPATKYAIDTFKRYVKQRNEAKSEKIRANNAANIAYYLTQYKGLEQYDMSTTKPVKANDYVEIKLGGVLVRNEGKQLLIKVEEKFDYSEFEVQRVQSTLATALDLVAKTAKAQSTSAVEI